MANKVLWQELDNITISSEEFDIYEFISNLADIFGDGYKIEIWEHADYSKADILKASIGWIADHTKYQRVEDLQVETWWTSDDEQCFTVVALKTKEA